MLHAVTNQDFRTAIRALERADLGVEGVTEFFTRRIYGDIASRAASDAALRLRIEGAAGPAFTPPLRTSYTDFFDTVTSIFHLLDDNIENMRQAYFRGRVEYLGLGSWNELVHDLPVQRGNAIGGAVLVESAGGSLEAGCALVRASYGRLIWGHSGSFQIDLRGGAGLTYLSEGQRLGLGPEVSLGLRASHLFIEGGALLAGSVAATGPALPRLDALLHVEAGAQIGRFQIGPTLGGPDPGHRPSRRGAIDARLPRPGCVVRLRPVMRGLLVALWFLGCTGVPRRPEGAMDPQAICLLVDGNWKAWRGLGLLDRSQLPSCVGARIGQGSHRFRLVLLATDTYRAPSGAEVRVYYSINGGRVDLIDVKPSSSSPAAASLASLGAPTATHAYSADDRAAANLPAPPGGTIEEAIYADQGLAIAVARRPSGEAVVVRVRGFDPMPAARYLDEYVRFEPEML